MKIGRLLLVLAFSAFLVVSSVSVVADSQVYENSYGRLTVTPRTSTGIGLQKQFWQLDAFYSAVVDVAFCFNVSLDYGRIYRWDGAEYVNMPVEHVEFDGKHYYVLDDLNIVDGNVYSGYWEYRPSYPVGKWDMYVKLSTDSWSGYRIHLDPYWNASYGNRYTLEVNNKFVNATLTNFPVLVVINSTVAANSSFSDGRDIRFVNSANTTEFFYEIDCWNQSGNSFVWVNIPSVNATGNPNTKFNLYIGNPLAVDNQTKESVWDANYMMVLHLNESTATANDDSTSNNNDVTAVAGNTLFGYNAIDKVVGHAVKFDGVNDVFFVGDSNSLSFGDASNDVPFTFEVWGFPYVTTKYAMFHKGTNAQREYGFGITGGNQYSIQPMDAGSGELGAYQVAAGIAANQWTYFSASYNANELASGLILFENGVKQSVSLVDSAYTAMHNTVDNLTVGTNFDDGDDANGLIDEIRISNIQRSAAWQRTTFYTMNNATHATASDRFILWTDYETNATEEVPPSGDNDTNGTASVDDSFHVIALDESLVFFILWLFFFWIVLKSNDKYVVGIIALLESVLTVYTFNTALWFPDSYIFLITGVLAVPGIALYRIFRDKQFGGKV